MKTLIELYDDRPLENVLATEVFRPETTIFLCPPEVAGDKSVQQRIKDYFLHRGLKNETVFLETSLLYADKVMRQLKRVSEQYPDCVLDITGGSDAALFASGLFCSQSNMPVLTYSRKRNCFFDISNAPFADKLECTVRYMVEDCFLMAGGAMREGRVDNDTIWGYMDYIEPFFDVFMQYRRDWNDIVGYFQRISQTGPDEPIPLSVSGDYTVKGERGSRISAPEEALRDFQEIGLISNLNIRRDEHVSFDFKDHQIRSWLRDNGQVLELYVYKICLDARMFQEVRTSVIVDWEGDFRRDNVTNEIDVMAARGVVPLFISCKTCAVSTEALNELAILRDRFGGQMAKAAIVASERCRAITRHRASELNIEVIDLEDIEAGVVGEQIRKLMGLENG
ncbi:MAG: DUF1887 family protein [Oscillospiraceae bacterium]|nr:DUF1887 family protein [Oscillospiraceae bacterium]